MRDERVERWLAALLATPGLTSLTDPAEARRVHLDDALAALDLVEAGPVVDVGSGGGSPGPPARRRAARTVQVTLLESSARKCAFLEEHAAAFPEPGRRLRPRGGARSRGRPRRVRDRARPRARAASGRGRVVPPARRARRPLRPLRRRGRRGAGGAGGRRGGGPPRAGRRRARLGAPPPAGRREARTDAGALSAAARRGEETSSRLSSLQRMAGRIYALANQKGGVGKTTTAVNLAACLAEAGERTLVVDLDPQANATSGLGERANGTSTADLLDGAALAGARPPDAVPEPRPRAVEARPGRHRGRARAARDDGETYLGDSLAGARDDYAFVFVDCPPSLGPLTVNALAAADRVIVPIQCEYYALEGLTQLLDSIERIRGGLNPRLVARRAAPDHGRRPHPALGRRGGRGARPLRRSRLRRGRAPQRAPRRGAEPRPSDHRVRPALARERTPTTGWRRADRPLALPPRESRRA